MKLRYNFRVYPTARQIPLLAQAFGCARVVYNDGLRARKDAYGRGESFIPANELQKMVTTLARKTPERSWLAEVSAVVLVQSLADLHAGCRNFFAWRRGDRKGPRVQPPTYKRKSGRQAIRLTRNGFRIREDGALHLAKIGEVRVKWSRPLPAEPSSVTIIKDSSGRYFASFVVEVNQQRLPPLELDVTDTGIDLGLSTYAVLRDRKIASPKFFRRQEKKLRRAQRHLSRCKKGGSNRRKAKLAVARIHARIADKRHNFIEQETTGIVRESQAVYLEDLNVKGMAARRSRLGTRWFPSTQMCSNPNCGELSGPKGRRQLHVRSWTCNACGSTHDRDENAEINLRREGRKLAAGHAER
ncbi:RNA-guided endonuclease InsQ/TnpB family protein [Streptomyces olivaceoviridis]|uniref:RNA-guided endonuclease InsQ/TnpB family protein n=1 Tax=Streptomyces olivaceoviridis TaxID=1921 RepID=UPI0036A208F9